MPLDGDNKQHFIIFCCTVSHWIGIWCIQKVKFEYAKVEYDPLEHDTFLDNHDDGESI